jgi:hypothetical protein
MRMTTLAVLVFGLVIVDTDRGRAQPSVTPSELADDALGSALWHIAVATQTKIGFESVEFVHVPGQLKNVPTFPVSSRDEALTAALDANPRYERRSIGDIVVVRPRVRGTSPLIRSIDLYEICGVENAQPHGVILGLRDFIYTNKFAVLPGGQAIPVSFDVQAGTVVDALNRLLESSDTVLWIASYRPNAQADQRFPSWDLQISTRNSITLQSETDSHPPRGLKTK